MNFLGNIDRELAIAAWLDYLNKQFPGSKRRILSRVRNNLGQDNIVADEDNGTPWYEQIANAAAAIIPTYINYKTQEKVLDAQIERAKAGQAPISQEYYKPVMQTPATTIRHEVSPTMPQFDQEEKNLLWLGGGTLLAVLLYSMSK